MPERIAIALSGGVDSAVAAARLVDSGLDVIGLTMKTAQAVGPSTPSIGLGAGSSGQGRAHKQGCCGLTDVDDARRIAHKLGIPHFVVDMSTAFEADVIGPFVDEYLHGRTPNPCVACNNTVKFGALHEHAQKLGADRVATGHYARVFRDETTGRYVLAQAADPTKDQTYVLCRLTQEQLAAAVFPNADTPKDQLRVEAAERGLSVAAKPDSQEICFIPNNDYRTFVAKREPSGFIPGLIKDSQTGEVMGEHAGIAAYTIGQRQGLNLGGQPEPHFVVGFDAEDNAVLVGTDDRVFAASMAMDAVVWVSEAAPEGEVRVMAKIRHQHQPVPATLRVEGPTRVVVEFDEPQRAVTPGQTAACYVGDRVLCGGVIS